MALALESAAETQEPSVVGRAELSALPDGSHALALATPEGPLLFRAFFARPSAGAVVLAGPPAFAEIFAEMALRFSAQGAACLVSLPRDAAEAERALAAGARWLRRTRPERLVLVGAADAAEAAMHCARPLDAEALLLLSPTSPPGPRAQDELCGRPLIVAAGEDDAPARAYAFLPHTRIHSFPLAGAALAQVQGDLLACCMPALAQALFPGAGSPGRNRA